METYLKKPVSLMSVNILFDNQEDKDHPWAKRKHVLKEFILEHDPILICTQEGREKQIRELSELLPLTLLEHHRSWIAERMYPNIFYDADVIFPLESGDLWLSETPHIPGSSSFNSRFPRLATWLKGIYLPTRQPFLLINMHLDHEHKEVRLEQIKVFLKELKKVEQNSYWPMIICGDFNEGPQEDVMTEIFRQQPGLIDPWSILNHHERPSFHKFGFSYTEAKRIDWILMDQRLSPQNMFFEERRLNGHFPSDHYPLICQFHL